ncbi:MAG: valine--tRNA ligase [Candidatus Woesebacteria bacterium]|nr:MAG: valine--tRNA ligase [Candidatus Woesebacteria bacterium]
MDKTYNHKENEARIYELWEKNKVFEPNLTKGKNTFSIIMPPPNANDPLHIGHARFVAIEDILIRYHRMKGDVTLWLPGSDHAGIETQFVFEKKLKEKGESRFDYDRETLYKMIWDYVSKNTGAMKQQLKQLGASCDWSRHKFTLDPEIIKIVYQTFKRLWEEKKVYRGEKVVNYCTFCGTAYSELEVNHIERMDPLYYVKFPKANRGHITIATTRPETIYVDTYLAVNPKDKRYKNLKSEKILNPLSNNEMKIIEDSFVDPEFGTGIVKITPAHDFNDEEICLKHGIPSIQVVGTDGKIMNVVPEKYGGGEYIKEARRKVVAELEKEGLIEKIDQSYKHVIGVCYRCKNVIEPMPMMQWFIKMESLAALGLKAIKDKKVKFVTKKYEKVAMHWLTNLRDWNISRQIVWGIRIPAWKCQKCSQWTITDGETPKKCSECSYRKLVQDIDTFDTWFSSGQWPFATLKTTKKGDFEYFYPTTVMNTAYDILPFWVIRMIMLSLYVTGKVPFEEVLIHGLIRDKQGQKISKSKGNVIDPIGMVEKYGSDSLRMGLVWGALTENDVSLSEDNIRGQRNFANKIWNASRFIQDKKGNGEKREDKEFYKHLEEVKKLVTKNLDSFKISQATESVYTEFWHWFCDECIEKCKKGELSEKALREGLVVFLKLLHPFAPFVTEAIWSFGYAQDPRHFDSPILALAKWPL